MGVHKLISFVLLFLIGFYQNVSALVFELDDSNFDETIKGNAMVMVMFYAPWCGACSKALPELSEVAALYERHDDVIFGRVNGFEERILSLRYDVDNFPTIVLFPFQREGVKYKGRVIKQELRKVVRDEILKNEDLIKAGQKVRGEIPQKPTILPRMEQNIEDIHIDAFNRVALLPNKHAFVSIYAPGCTDGCYVFAQVAETYQNEDSIVFVSLDFTRDARVTKGFTVVTNPTFYWYPKADKDKGLRYGGGFDALEIIDFINAETGMARNIGGALKPDAGRIPELDKLIKDSIGDIMTNSVRMDNVYEKAKHLAERSKHGEKYKDIYLGLLERIQIGEAVEDVIQQTYDQVNQLLENASTRKENDELVKHRNILNAFIDMGSDMLDDGEEEVHVHDFNQRAQIYDHRDHDEL